MFEHDLGTTTTSAKPYLLEKAPLRSGVRIRGIVLRGLCFVEKVVIYRYVRYGHKAFRVVVASEIKQ